MKDKIHNIFNVYFLCVHARRPCYVQQLFFYFFFEQPFVILHTFYNIFVILFILNILYIMQNFYVQLNI